MVRTRFILFLLAASGCLLLLSPGCDELVTETIKITIAGHPTAEYRIVDTGNLGDSGCLIGDTFKVWFEDASSGPVVKWIWNFGDSIFDTLYLDSGDNGDISHTYTRIGTFTVTLAVFDAGVGADLETKKNAVIIGHSIDSMTISASVVCPGDSIWATAHNPFGVETWNWNFGDGDTTTNSNPVQTHAYGSPGEYELKLTVNGDCGSTILIDTVNVLHCAQPYFTIKSHDISAGDTAYFTDSTPPAIIDTTTGDTLGIVDEWLWDFGEGTPDYYPTAPGTVNHVYDTAGVFEVTLTVTTDSGGVTSYADTIIVHPGVANFAFSDTTACQEPGTQFIVAFTRESAGDTAWLWDFGDGFTSSSQNTYHHYTTPGTYLVELTVYGGCGDSTTLQDSVPIVYSDQLADSIAFSITADTANDYRFTFTDLSPGAVVKYWEWDFGDDKSATDSVISHIYQDTGTYQVTLTIFNSCDTLVDSGEVVVDTTSNR